MLSDLVYRFRALFRRSAVEAEMNDELCFHFEQEVNKYEKSGMPREEALRRARLAFGGIEQAKEACREARGVNFIQTVFQDIRYGTRTLRKSRGFTAITLLTLALGIGATTAIFSVVDAVLLRPLPYQNPGRLVLFFTDLSGVGNPRARISPPTYMDLKAQKRLFEDVAAANETAFNLSGNSGGGRQLNGILATYNLFSVLGVKPMLGRTFLPEEDRPGANHVVLLSYASWQSRFDGNRRIIGQKLRLNDQSYIVIGVMPSGFSFPEKELNRVDVWIPRAFTAEELTARRARYLLVVGRLQPGISTWPSPDTAIGISVCTFKSKFWHVCERFRELGAQDSPATFL